MSFYRNRIQFRNQPDMRFSMSDTNLESCLKVFCLYMNSMLCKFFLNKLLCFKFFITEFWMHKQLFAECNHLILLCINHFINLCLHIISFLIHRIPLFNLINPGKFFVLHSIANILG